jgi:hypothetical protein
MQALTLARLIAPTSFVLSRGRPPRGEELGPSRNMRYRPERQTLVRPCRPFLVAVLTPWNFRSELAFR